MDMKLELVVLPVTDVDRAKGFYTGLGWRLDADVSPGPDFRVVQMTPPGSSCSVTVGPVIVDPATPPGPRASLQLVVTDIEAARAELAGRGLEVGDVQVLDPRDGGKFLFFADPDGNPWAIQEIRDHVGAAAD